VSQKSWSLASRLTKLFAITTSLLVLATTLTSYVYISNSKEKGLEHLLREEIDELATLIPLKEEVVEEVAAAALELCRGHADTPLAWRVWRTDLSKPWGEFGVVSLLGQVQAPLNTVDAQVQSFDGGMRVLVQEVDGPYTIACVVDGSKELGQLRNFGVLAVLLVIGATGVNLLMGRMLLNGVSKTLRQVAESARHVAHKGGSIRVDIQNAPQEIHEVVNALQEMLSKAQQEAERNRVFTASMAHELRSPIQNLMGETEVALISTRNSAEYRRVLESHLQDLRDLADAVDNLVTICSQPASGWDLKTTRESFELADEAKLRLARESGYAAARGVKLNLESSGNTRIYGDREGLLRAMRNLTANAIEWSEPGGQVDVRVLGENGEIDVVVDDGGPGVPEELKERIFEAFFRGPQARGRRIGYGLGLAIVRAAVDAHGGVVEVGRSPKGGARFRMRLPRGHHLLQVDDTPLPL